MLRQCVSLNHSIRASLVRFTREMEVIKLRKYTFLAVLTVALFFAMSSAAYANFGPHGGYSDDTDSCAACHRAHTSFSPIQRTNYLGGQPIGTIGSALLVSSAQNMREFCTVCHGNDAPGASTNVIAGVFDGGPSAPHGTNIDPGAGILYATNSTFGGTLNAGGFRYLGGTAPVTSMHSMSPVDSPDNPLSGTIAPLWGFGSAVTNSRALLSEFTCTSCHDPHGSTNYRLLKDSLPGGAVGGFNAAGQPDPFVISSEEGYPVMGWLRGEAGALQMADYRPNYTAPQYRNTGLMGENISGWCAGCHQRYDESGTAYNYEGFLAAVDAVGTTHTVGARSFHRHPVNRTVGSMPNVSLSREPVIDSMIPLERLMSAAPQASAVATWTQGDMLGCLTCHRAHGTSATMEGWAESSLAVTTTGETTWVVQVTPGSGGVNPNRSSSLLRADNRGVCQRCHNM